MDKIEEQEVLKKLIENRKMQNILRRREACLDRRMRRYDNELFEASLLLDYRYCVVNFQVNSIELGTYYYKVCSFNYERLEIMIIDSKASFPIVINECNWDEFYYDIYMMKDCKPITKEEFDREFRKVIDNYTNELLNF